MTPAAKEARNAYMREYMKTYRQQKKTQINEAQRLWQKSNQEKVKKYKDRYWEKKAQEALNPTI